MNIKSFLEECNRSSIFKNHSLITKNSLESVDLIKDDYTSSDMNLLRERLFFMPPRLFLNTSEAYKKENRDHKDLQHSYKLDLEKNKERIREMRKTLNMPYAYRGMISIQSANEPCEYINIPLSNLDKVYKNWLLSFVKNDPGYKRSRIPNFYIAEKVGEAINNQVYKLLSEWNLSIRYFDALISLVLFNEIVPARSDILLKYNYINNDKNHPFLSISFDVDTTKEDLARYIQELPNETLERYRKHSGIKQYKRSQIANETREMKRIYIQRKKGYSTDKEVFEYLASMYDCSPYAVRKRIKGK